MESAMEARVMMGYRALRRTPRERRGCHPCVSRAPGRRGPDRISQAKRNDAPSDFRWPGIGMHIDSWEG